jgi:hypothetical protein
MKIMFMIALLASCTPPVPQTSAQGSNLECSVVAEHQLTICQDKFVRCYMPMHGGIHCMPIK